MESDTPRTDAVSWIGEGGVRVIRAEDAQILERELAAAIKQRDEAQKEICELVAESEEAITGFTTTAKQIAARRGYDCFAEGGGA